MTSMSMLMCRKPDADASSPLDNDVHTQVPVGVKGRTAFHLVADGHPLQEAGCRVDQRLVLVYLRVAR